MEFRETLLAAQRNQQQKSSERTFYKARFDPPKKEQKSKDRLSANIQKFLAKKEEEERQKKLEAQRKKEEFIAMRDPKALRKIQKTLKVIKSANKSVLADAIDKEHTAVTLQGPDQPDQDDYGYESQEAAALYEKMMQKYSKLPEEPKFTSGGNFVSKDINGTRERVKNALQHEDESVPHKRRRRTENGDRELSPLSKYEPEKKKDEKSDKPKIRKPAPPPIDFNQLLKLAEQKKSEPIEIAAKKVVTEPEPDRLMTKKQKREYEEEMARQRRRQERIEAAKAGKKVPKEEKSDKNERERKPETAAQNCSFGRIPKITDRNSNKSESPKVYERDKDRNSNDREREKLQKDKERMRIEKERFDREKERYDREKERYDRQKEKFDREKEKSRLEREREREKYEKERLDKERLDKLKAERDRIDREMERLNRDRERLEKTKVKLENKSNEKLKEKIVDRSKTGSRERDIKKSIDLKSQNTYRIDKNSNEKKVLPQKSIDPKLNGHSKPVPKLNKETSKDQLMRKPVDAKLNGVKDKRVDNSKLQQKRPDEKRPVSSAGAGPSKPVISNSFDFDKHVNSLNKNGVRSTGDMKRKQQDDRRMQKRRMVESDSEYDSEMDDFIDDRDENLDYSKHIKEIFGYDKSKYRYIDDDDDPTMESSFARQQREEYISKKIGIMEDLEDMRMEAMQKSKSKKRRRISDD